MFMISQPWPKVIVESVSQQEEIFPQPLEVEELLVETLVDILAELTLKLVPPLAAIRVSFFLRSPDVYDPLQIFLQEICSQEISILICGSVFSEAELTCHAVCILLELPSTATCLSRKLVPPPPPWSRCDALVLLARPPPWPD